MSDIYLKLELSPGVNLWIKAEDLANTSSAVSALVSSIITDQINFYDESTADTDS